MSLNSEVEERFLAAQADIRFASARKNRPAPLGMTPLGLVEKETKFKMKHFVFGFCAVLWLTFGPVRVTRAQHWGRDTGPGPRGAGADQKVESTSKHAGNAQLEKPTPIYTSPKSVGWLYKTPAPMGAGADTKFYFYSKWTRPHFRRPQGEKLTPLYTSPKSVGWWRKGPGPMGAGAEK